jgi:hypothetical protein
MRQHVTALSHDRVAAAAMPALLAWQPRPPREFKRSEWILADRVLRLTKSYNQVQQTLCDTLARRRPAQFDLTHELSPYLVATHSAEPPVPLVQSPLTFRSRSKLRRAWALLPEGLEQAFHRFQAALAAKATPSPRRAIRREAAARAAYEKARQERQAARRAAQPANTPLERSYQSRGYADFGRDQLRIVKRMTDVVHALQHAAPQILDDTDPGRALRAAYEALGQYHQHKLSNGELERPLNDLIFSDPPSPPGTRSARSASEHQQASLLWQSVIDRARALIREKSDLRSLELAADESHLARLREGRPESIETSSLHLDILRDLKRIHSHICSVAYPVLEVTGELQPNRLREGDVEVASQHTLTSSSGLTQEQSP